MELTLDDLTCRRGGRTVFRNLSFRLGAGTAALLRGPNGAGKSSLLRMIAGLVPLGGGDARLGDLSLARDSTEFQVQIAYAGHLDAIKLPLTVTQNLRHWAAIFGAASERIDEAMAFFGLDHIPDRMAGECSAGQRRRLGLARLMGMDRPLWLLDEPTVSLDQESTAKVAELVQRHCAGGGLALIATHIDLGLGDAPVLQMSGRVAETVETATPDSFLAGDWT